MVAFLDRHELEEDVRLDVLIDAAKAEAAEYLGSLEEMPRSEEEFWEAMRRRFGLSEDARLRRYENMRQTGVQTLRQYADALSKAAYGLNIPFHAQRRKFLNSMRQTDRLKGLLLLAAKGCTSLSEIADVAEGLAEELGTPANHPPKRFAPAKP